MKNSSLGRAVVDWIASDVPVFRPSPKFLMALGLIFSVLVVGIFDALFFNRYYPLSEGWFLVYARFMQQGFLPYRDFHLFLTPVYQLLTNLFVRFFGYSIYGLRLAGLGLSLVMTALVYLIALELMPASIAFVSAVFAVIYYQSSVVFINYDFLHFLTVFGLLACWLLCGEFGARPRRNIRFPWRVVAAGLFAGLAFLTKQSNGLFVALFLGIAALLAALAAGRAEAFKTALWFSLGLGVSFSLLAGWLLANGLWNAFMNDAVMAGAASKGGVGTILWGWIPRLIDGNRLKGLLSAFVLLCIFATEGYWRFGRPAKPAQPTRHGALVQLGLYVGLLLFAILLPYQWIRGSYAALHHFRLNNWHSLLSLIGTVFGCILVALGIFRVFWIKAEGSLPLLIVGLTCAGFFIGNGTSAAIDMAGVFLPVGLLGGFLLGMPVRAPWSKAGVAVFGLSLVFYMCSEKYVTPYLWWGLSQADVRQVAPLRGIPELAGMRVSYADDGVILNRLVDVVKRYSTASDSLYTFPYMSQLHLLTGRNPPTYAAVHWFDVASDAVAAHDAQILRSSPPKIVVFLDIPALVWTEHEKGFRNGNLCGQREIRDVLARSIDQGLYTLVYKHRVPDENFVTVWVRKNPTGRGSGANNFAPYANLRRSSVVS